MNPENNSYLSIDLNDEGAAIVCASRPGPGACALVRYAFKSGVSVKQKRSELKDFINDFLSSQDSACRRAYLTIFDPDDILIKNITMPAVPKSELKDALKYQLKEDESFEMEGALCDFRINRETADAAGAKKYEISLIACQAQTLKAYTDLLKECGISLEGITAAPFNYEKIIEKISAVGPVEAVLDVGQARALLCVFDQKKLVFSRVIPLVVLPSGGASFSLVREVDSSFKYLTANMGLSVPGVVYLSGPAAAGLKDYCAKNLNVRCEEVPLPGCVQVDASAGEQFAKDKNMIISALGAALASNREVNLLARDSGGQSMTDILGALEPIVKSVYVRLAAGFLVLLAAAFIFLLAAAQSRVKQAAAQAAEFQKAFNARYGGESEDDPLGRIRSGKLPVRAMLVELSGLVPADIILEEMAFDQAVRKLVFKGRAAVSSSHGALGVMGFKEGLAAWGFIKSVRPPALSSEGNVQKFSLECETL